MCHRTQISRLDCSPSTAKTLKELFNAKDAAFNQLVDKTNLLISCKVSPDMIKKQIDSTAYKPPLQGRCERFEKNILKKLVDNLESGKIKELFHRAADPYSRLMSFDFSVLQGLFIVLPGMEPIPIRNRRPLPYTASVYRVDIKEYNYGKSYMIQIHYRTEILSIHSEYCFPENILALDYKQDGLYVDSCGRSGEYPDFFTIGAQRQAGLYRRREQCRHGSASWKKADIALRNHILHMKNQRKDWQYKRAAELAEEYDAIAVESLDFKSMIENRPELETKIRHNDWPGFLNRLEASLFKRGKELIYVNQHFPSSQICSACGYRFGPLPLEQRTIRCPKCNTVADRDVNAAKNIRSEALRILSERL